MSENAGDEATRKPKARLRRRVLIAEHDPKLAGLLARSLTEEGFSTHVAATGANAIALTDAFEFDAAVLDAGLPGVNGFDVCRQLRVRGSRANVVVIGAYEAGRETDRAGADDFLLKPFGLNELARRLSAPEA